MPRKCSECNDSVLLMRLRQECVLSDVSGGLTLLHGVCTADPCTWITSELSTQDCFSERNVQKLTLLHGVCTADPGTWIMSVLCTQDRLNEQGGRGCSHDGFCVGRFLSAQSRVIGLLQFPVIDFRPKAGTFRMPIVVNGWC